MKKESTIILTFCSLFIIVAGLLVLTNGFSGITGRAIDDSVEILSDCDWTVSVNDSIQDVINNNAIAGDVICVEATTGESEVVVNVSDLVFDLTNMPDVEGYVVDNKLFNISNGVNAEFRGLTNLTFNSTHIKMNGDSVLTVVDLSLVAPFDSSNFLAKDMTPLNIKGTNNILIIEGENVFDGRGQFGFFGGFGVLWAFGGPGIQVQANRYGPNDELTIEGNGKLVTYGAYCRAAIGGGIYRYAGDVIINSGEIYAYGGSMGAAIGGGQDSGRNDETGATWRPIPSPQNITINGGEIYAYGGPTAAGIGTGGDAYNDTSGGTITINGGVVEATGGLHGAGIGCGRSNAFSMQSGNGGNISIYISTVTAYAGSDWAAAIGGGANHTSNPPNPGGDSGNITVCDDVVAVGGVNATDIGHGYGGENQTIIYLNCDSSPLVYNVDKDQYYFNIQDAINDADSTNNLRIEGITGESEVVVNVSDLVFDLTNMPDVEGYVVDNKLFNISNGVNAEFRGLTNLTFNSTHIKMNGDSVLTVVDLSLVAPFDSSNFLAKDMTPLNIKGTNNILIIEGENVFDGRGQFGFFGGFGVLWAFGGPGIQVQANRYGPNDELTIEGNGKLVTYGAYCRAAIGGGIYRYAGDVIINSGEIYAYGGSMGAAIGGGQDSGRNDETGATWRPIPSPQNITINGGEIYAYGGPTAAGIGTGGDAYNDTSGGTITINGGVVEATGGLHGAGIGCGRSNAFSMQSGNGGNISIYISTVTAYAGSDWAAAIGGGANHTSNPPNPGGDSGNITVCDDVVAVGGVNATDIGHGYGGENQTIIYLNCDPDIIPPNLTIHSPESKAYSTKTILVNIIAEDDVEVDAIWYNWNGTNVSYVNETNVEFNEGENVLHVWVNDTSGNINYTNVTFLVDIHVPTITIHSPDSITYFGTNRLVNITAEDNIGVEAIWYNWNGNNNVIHYSDYIEESVIFSAGNVLLEVWANDSAGNIGYNNVNFIAGHTIYENVSSTGVLVTNVTINGGEANSSEAYYDEKEVQIKSDDNPIIEFNYDFSQSDLNLSEVKIEKSSNSIIVNMSNVIQPGFTKTVYLEDNNFISLCAKDAPVVSISELSDGCNETNEVLLDECLNGNYTDVLSGISCTKVGNVFKIENLQHSIVVGRVATTLSRPSGGSGRRIIEEEEPVVIFVDESGELTPYVSEEKPKLEEPEVVKPIVEEREQIVAPLPEPEMPSEVKSTSLLMVILLFLVISIILGMLTYLIFLKRRKKEDGDEFDDWYKEKTDEFKGKLQ
jgi:hypothetical protein